MSLALTNALSETVARAHRAGFPVKVALIAAPDDLGSVPFIFGYPRRYAEFLDQEISFQAPVKLIVAMPQGVAEAAAGPASALRGIRVTRDGGSDALARAAITAIAALAARAGHPITPAPIVVASRVGSRPRSGSGTSWPLIVLVVAGLGVAGLVARRSRRLRAPAASAGRRPPAGPP